MCPLQASLLPLLHPHTAAPRPSSSANCSPAPWLALLYSYMKGPYHAAPLTTKAYCHTMEDANQTDSILTAGTALTQFKPVPEEKVLTGDAGEGNRKLRAASCKHVWETVSPSHGLPTSNLLHQGLQQVDTPSLASAVRGWIWNCLVLWGNLSGGISRQQDQQRLNVFSKSKAPHSCP